MLHCDQCKQNDATIFLTQIVEGEITKAALCATFGEPFVQAAAESPQVRDYLQRHRVDVFAEVADRDARYTKEAFWFVRDGVHQAVRSRAGGSRHVTAHELLETLRILALERYGTKLADGTLARLGRNEGVRKMMTADRAAVVGSPDLESLTTSHIERAFLTTRQELKRFGRKTLGYSKSVEMHKHAVAIHFGVYNFVRKHHTLGTTPAVAAGLEEKPWSLEQVVQMTASYIERSI